MLLLVIAGVLVVALLLRVVPLWLSPQGAGIDHWFWKSWVEAYRRTRRFPPELPQYLLDEHQWYPPVFPLLLSMMPDGAFDRWNRTVAIAIDLLRMALLLGVAHWQSDGSVVVIGLAGLLYATTPIQIFYNVQLNPRGLGALLLDALLVLLLLNLDAGGPPWTWVVIVAFSGLILLTHKMTTQLFWFVMLGTAVLYQDWRVLALVPASLAAAMVLSGGFYGRVLRAHWDIVTFWNRHWRWIGADVLRESPIYGDGTYERPEKLHRAGWPGFRWHLFLLVAFNPSAWIACLLTYERLAGSAVLIYPTPLLVWLLLPCLFAGLTTFVPVMKCLGAGYLYVYNTSLVASLLLALTFQYTRVPEFSTPFVVLALLLNIAGTLVYYRQFVSNKRGRVHEGLDEMIETLRGLPQGAVMCIPPNWYEVVAYRTGQPVLWGAHGYGFRKVEPTWPRLLLPVGDILRRHDIRYLLTMDGMMTPEFAAELPPARRLSSGEYHLYCFGETPDVQ